jgi:predicted DNA-binding protein (MmcQ/YjbR family)
MATDFAARLKTFAMAFPDAREEYPFGAETTMYKAANGKMFALCGETDVGIDVSLKLTPEEGEEALTLPFVRPAPYMARHAWINARVSNPVEFDMLVQWVRRSHELVTAKGKRLARR